MTIQAISDGIQQHEWYSFVVAVRLRLRRQLKHGAACTDHLDDVMLRLRNSSCCSSRRRLTTLPVDKRPPTSCRLIYTVSGKKETNMFSVISPTKRGQLRWNLAHSFLNKFAATWSKRFPPHLNNVSTLPCETWNAHRARATIALLDRETPEFIPPQLWSPNSPDLNPVDYRVWEISQEKM